jgi:hypothetical protein
MAWKPRPSEKGGWRNLHRRRRPGLWRHASGEDATTVGPCAEFRADFPDDKIEKGGEIVLFGGRGVTKAPIAIVQGLGYQPDPIRYGGDHGWELGVRNGENAVWFRSPIWTRSIIWLQQVINTPEKVEILHFIALF